MVGLSYGVKIEKLTQKGGIPYVEEIDLNGFGHSLYRPFYLQLC
jgi:hypothetical protein